MRNYPLIFEAGLLMVYARITGPKGSRLSRLALDTGATTTMVPPKAALAIGVNPARSTTFRDTLTASGKELTPIVVIPSFHVFEHTFRHLAVACHELPAESPIDGLLGLDVLTQLQAILNLGKREIVIP